MEVKHLEAVLSLLNIEVEKLKSELENVDQDVQKQKEYYWENYSEFDEYGYEHYDNEQQMYATAYTKSSKIKELYRYEKMLDSPYFGRIDFVYDGEDEPETYYIGLGNFSPVKTKPPVVFDWRAPVSGLFYDYDKGPAGFDAPGGRMEGEILQKKQFKIKGGKMIYSFVCDMKIDDDILKQELSKLSDHRLKSIVTTIQKEQNRLIRADKRETLVVQGCAGSGKTSVALHRIAYLLYHNRESLRANHVLILTPNFIFSDYISHILPELGEEPIREMSFDDFAAKELKEYCRCEERYDYIEQLLTFQRAGFAEERERRHRQFLYKQSKEFCKKLHGFVLELEQNLVDFRAFAYKNYVITREEMVEYFYEKFPDIPILQRMEHIAEYVLDRMETLKGRDFEEEEREQIREKFLHMYGTRNVYRLYQEFLGQDANGDEYPLLAYEDVYPTLYLKYLMLGNKEHRMVKHLVIDEMQDYSYLQYLLISRMFTCPMTILGDKAQTLTEERQNVMCFLPQIFRRNMTFITMKKSYRSTMEIGTFAGKLINDTETEYFPRHGKKPAIYHETNLAKVATCLVEQIAEQKKMYETIGILCRSIEEAEELYRLLRKKMDVTLLHKDSSTFTSGVMVTTYYMAKGLEFDAVHGVYPKGEEELDDWDKQMIYLCATRAMHELSLYYMDEGKEKRGGIWTTQTQF